MRRDLPDNFLNDIPRFRGCSMGIGEMKSVEYIAETIPSA